MRRACVVLFAAFLWACVAGPPPERKRGLDPSNPDAPESNPLPVSTALAPEPGHAEEPEKGRDHEGHPPGAMQHGEHGSAEPGVAEYTCPMHPEVSNPAPGQCPKCGMALVPRKQKAPPGASGQVKPPHEERHEGHEERR